MLKQIMMCDMCGEEIPTYEKEVLRWGGLERNFTKQENLNTCRILKIHYIYIFVRSVLLKLI